MQPHSGTAWQPWEKPGRWVLLSRSYLMCPPHHQVREYCNPGDWAEERDGEELSRCLKENQDEVRQSNRDVRWRGFHGPKPNSPLQLPLPALPLPWVFLGLASQRPGWAKPGQSDSLLGISNLLEPNYPKASSWGGSPLKSIPVTRCSGAPGPALSRPGSSRPCSQPLCCSVSSLPLLLLFLSSAQVHQNQFLLLQSTYPSNLFARKSLRLITLTRLIIKKYQ